MNASTEINPAEVVVTEAAEKPRKKRGPYKLKANTKASQVRALVKRWHKHPHAETIILKKTMELGFTRALAKVYIKGSAQCQGIVLPTLAPAPQPSETAEA